MWAKEYERCITCRTREIPHFGKGYCRKCYHKVSVSLRINRLEINRRIGKTQKEKRSSMTNIKERLTLDALKDLYLFKRMSFGDISRQYNCSRTYILKLCRLYNIPTRDKFKARSLAVRMGKLPFDYHKINERFFEAWSKEMAYVLGLLYADGNMNKHKRSFSLSLKDKNFLERIRSALNSTHPIKKSKIQELYNLVIGNTKMSEDLLKLGLIPRKSLKIKFPNIPDIYISHFIRGYFDGDGFIDRQQKKSYYAGFVSGAKDFIYSIRDKLEKLVDVSAQKITNHKTATAYYVCYYRRSDIEKLYNFFYDEYTISKKLYLPRKFLKFQEAINSYKNWTINQLMSSRYSAKAKVGKMQTNDTVAKLITYWQLHRHSDANMADLARYASVSRDTMYRWLNRKAQPRAQKDKLIQEWLNQKNQPKRSSPGSHQAVTR